MNNLSIEKPSKMQMILASLISIVQTNILTPKTSYLPEKVMKYNLVCEIKKACSFKNYSIGLYMLRNKKYFIKTWTGKIKDINYYLLYNEYLTGVFLYKKTSFGKYSFKIAKPINFYNSNKSYSLIFEYIEGRSLSTYPIKKQAEVLSSAIKFLENISRSLSNKEKAHFINHGLLFYLLVFPFMMFAILLLNLKNYRSIIKAYFYSCLKTRKYVGTRLTLAHRDLNPNNIIVSKKAYYLIDNERLILTLPNYDITQLVTGRENALLIRNIIKTTKYSINSFLNTFLAFHSILDYNNFPKYKEIYLKKINYE